MESQSIISAIDAEIAKLEQVRELLANDAGLDRVKRGARPTTVAAKKAVKRTMSPEGRKRVADAQRKRWAAAKTLKAAVPLKATKKAAEETSPVKEKKATPKKIAKRTLSPQARKRIVDAQHKRWAAAKKLKSVVPPKEAKKAAKKTTPVKAKKAVPKNTTKAAPAGAMPEAQKAEAPF
jgi:hypothetical protein